MYVLQFLFRRGRRERRRHTDGHRRQRSVAASPASQDPVHLPAQPRSVHHQEWNWKRMFFCHFLILILQESITAHKLIALWLPSMIFRIFVLLDEYSTHAVHFLADSALFIDLHVANVVSDVQALSRILEASASGPSARAQVLSSRLGDVWPHGEHQGDLLEPDQYPSKAYANIFSVKTYIFCKIIVCISIFCANIRRQLLGDSYKLPVHAII